MDEKLSYCVTNDCLIFRFVLLRCGMKLFDNI
jgi:hypothetical protein